MQNPNPVSHTLEVLASGTAAPAAAAGDSLAYAVYNDADSGGTEHFLFAHAKVSVLHMLLLGWVDEASVAKEGRSSQPLYQHACICSSVAQYGVSAFLCRNSAAPSRSASKQPVHVITCNARLQQLTRPVRCTCQLVLMCDDDEPCFALV
jgi:hypothetical protein